MFGLYLKAGVVFTFAAICLAVLGLAAGLVALTISKISILDTTSMDAALTAPSTTTIPMPCLRFSPAATSSIVLTLGAVSRFFFDYALWRVVLPTLSFKHLEAAENVDAKGKPANALGEGLLGLLRIGGLVMADTPHEAPAFYFDGRHQHPAARHNPLPRRARDQPKDDAFVAAWPYPAIRRVDRYPDGLRLLAKGTPDLSRLEIKDADSEVLILERCRWINEFDPHLPTILQAHRPAADAGRQPFYCSRSSLGFPMLGDRVAKATPDTIDMASGPAVRLGLRGASQNAAL